MSGKLQMNAVDDKLLHSVLDNDKEEIDKGQVITESINQGLSSFTPDLMYEQLVQNYQQAERIYGEKIIRWVTGYDASYVERNIRIPEFKREIKENIKQRIKLLERDELIDKQGQITPKAVELATLVTYVEELDHITPKGTFGEHVHKKNNPYGEVNESRGYRKGDRYKDLSLRKSLRMGIKRGHSALVKDDLQVFDRRSKGECQIIYAIDSSGSMKGKKIDKAKKAGIALAYKAIENKDKVGLVVFDKDVSVRQMPTLDFGLLLREIIEVRASMETNIVTGITESIDLFGSERGVTKHLILLSDALPTIGKDPEEETIAAVARAVGSGITISIIGIGLDVNGEKLARRIVEIGNGRLYVTKDVDQLDKIILEDYYSVA